ncbi:MAG: hypothetical protein OXM57_06325 [bacterium]|nr:hypothetical protein [bacterium]MDE0352289.1 hypothetical protein [bacterium]
MVVVAVSTTTVVVVVDSVVEGDVVVDGDVVLAGTEMVEEVVVASAAGEVEEAAEVAGGDGELVATIGASVLVTEGSPLAGLAGSTRTSGAPPLFPERSADAAHEPHAAVPIIPSSTSTAICSLFTRLTLWLRRQLPPYRGRDRCDSAILNPEALSTTASPRLVQVTARA